MKKICFISTQLDGGGAQRVIVNLANSFSQHDYEVDFVCITSNNTQNLYALDEKIRQHNFPRLYKKNSRILKSVVKLLRKFLIDIEPDIVIPFLMPITAYAYKACRGLPVKFIVSERNDPESTPTDPFWRNMRDKIFSNADACVFQTKTVKSYFENRGIRTGFVIRNPLVLPANCLTPIKAAKRKKRIVCVSKYEPQKNLFFLIETFSEFLKEFPDYILEVYGNDYHRQRVLLIQQVRSLGIENNVFLHDSRDNIMQTILDARMSVLVSKYEGMPNALLESVALGVPSIATDAPVYAVREIIQDGENGFLIPVDDKSTLLEKMRLLANDDSLCDLFSNEGTKIRERYSSDGVFLQWENMIKKIGSK